MVAERRLQAKRLFHERSGSARGFTKMLLQLGMLSKDRNALPSRLVVDSPPALSGQGSHSQQIETGS